MLHCYLNRNTWGRLALKNKFCLLVICFILPLIGLSQNNKADLENKKKKIQSEIDYLTTVLENTTNKKETSLGQIMALNKKISLHEELINTINNEIAIIDGQIYRTKDTINALQAQLNELKKEYARMIVDAYKTEQGYNKLMFIFASKDFDQAALRMRYLQEYQEYRHKQALVIDSTGKEMDNKVDRLNNKKLEKEELLEGVKQEEQKLDAEKSEKQKLYNDIKGKEKQIRRQIAEKQRASQKLDIAIRKLIEEEIRKSNASVKKTNTNKMEMTLTPEAKALSENFESNKGKLPWPVAEGLIYRPFGTYSPMPGITMTNDGIDIATTKDAVARAVFDGQVSVVMDDPSYGKDVIIKHGNYYTVYIHLKDVFVKQGDKVHTKQNLGTILYDDQNNIADLELEIWKGQDKLDPQEWLYPK